MRDTLPQVRMPKSNFPDISPPVHKGWRNGAVPVRSTGPSAKEEREAYNRRATEAFMTWWHEVYNTGEILPPEAVAGVDYIGSLPWPTLVAISSLYAAYAQSLSFKFMLDERAFKIHLRQYTQIRHYGVRVVALTRPGKRKPISMHETFYRTGNAKGD